MTIVQQGSVNTNSLLVPDLLVQIVPPSVTLLNGVPTNVLGIVGTAIWGPVNSPAIAGGVSDATRQFGALQARKFDLGTAVAAASLQGAANFRLVRVTDGSDTAASGTILQAGVGSAAIQAGGTGHAVNDLITLTGGAVLKVLTVSTGAILTVSVQTPGSYSTPPSNPVAQASTTGTGTGATFNLSFPTGLTVTGKYSGSLGNSLAVVLGTGSNNTTGTPTFKLTISLPGQLPEVFDNVGGSGNTLYANMAAAINSGNGSLRGPSQLVVATAGAATLAPVTATVAMGGGTDGATTITASVLIGQDTIPRKGMYALRGTGASIVMLADADDSTQWTTQVAYGLSEGAYMIMTGPSGDTIANAVAAKATAGIDSYAAKLLFGDWVLINDNVNNQQRFISPQGYVAGLLANLSPEQSSLNKQLQGIVATQKSYQNQQYSNAELQALAQAGIDVITNPVPGGRYFGPRIGRNTSSNAVIHGDNYTRMTNFIASTINAGMGIYIGTLQTASQQRRAKATLDNYFANLAQPGMIGVSDGSVPWQVVLDGTNNPQSRVALGYEQADIKVIYLSIVEVLICNIEAGQSVQISRSSTQRAA